MKKLIIAAWVLSITIFVFPPSSFGWDGCVFGNKGEEIRGLVFDFVDEEKGGEGLELDLGDFGLPKVIVTDVEVQGSGNEKSYITPFNQFIYRTKLVDGWCNLKKGRIIAYLKAEVFGYSSLIFKFNKVRLFETYHISKGAADYACQNDTEPDVPADPTKVKIYFEAKKAKLTNIPGVTAKFNILLILKKGVSKLSIVQAP